MRKQITLAEAGDVMTTALEGGIGYWSQADQIHREANLTCVSYRLHDAADGSLNGDPDFKPTVVTRQMGRDAWKAVATEAPLRSDLMDQMADNTAEPGDAGGVDADVADCIVQWAPFGKVVYG